mmetsp:Transcript_86522/g.242281  ORF Transcript_86522/g.242281 Transcript_86522/m.242281 type:complete len:269 (+) Transcript_86522:386-1192(+)
MGSFLTHWMGTTIASSECLAERCCKKASVPTTSCKAAMAAAATAGTAVGLEQSWSCSTQPLSLRTYRINGGEWLCITPSAAGAGFSLRGGLNGTTSAAGAGRPLGNAPSAAGDKLSFAAGRVAASSRQVGAAASRCFGDRISALRLSLLGPALPSLELWAGGDDARHVPKMGRRVTLARDDAAEDDGRELLGIGPGAEAMPSKGTWVMFMVCMEQSKRSSPARTPVAKSRDADGRCMPSKKCIEATGTSACPKQQGAAVACAAVTAGV